jgi:hypothetical protein
VQLLLLTAPLHKGEFGRTGSATINYSSDTSPVAANLFANSRRATGNCFTIRPAAVARRRSLHCLGPTDATTGQKGSETNCSAGSTAGSYKRYETDCHMKSKTNCFRTFETNRSERFEITIVTATRDLKEKARQNPKRTARPQKIRGEKRRWYQESVLWCHFTRPWQP